MTRLFHLKAWISWVDWFIYRHLLTAWVLWEIYCPSGNQKQDESTRDLDTPGSEPGTQWSEVECSTSRPWAPLKAQMKTIARMASLKMAFKLVTYNKIQKTVKLFITSSPLYLQVRAWHRIVMYWRFGSCRHRIVECFENPLYIKGFDYMTPWKYSCNYML